MVDGWKEELYTDIAVVNADMAANSWFNVQLIDL